MNIEEIATKDDIRQLKKEILAALQSIATTPTPKIQTLEQAADYLGGMPISTLRLKANKGEIASIKAGKRVKFKTVDLDAYIAASRRRSNNEIQTSANGHMAVTR